MSRLKEEYKNRILSELMKSLNYKNPHEVPKLKKIVLNMGVGEAVQDPKILNEAVKDMSLISGQRPLVTIAKKAVSAFKLRKGKPIGCKVTLRDKQMYEFLDRLINFAIPRIRDFRGLNPNSFDNFGNYTFGVSEQTIFPEISYDKAKHSLGMDITIRIKSKKRKDAIELLRAFGMPFKSGK
ncbi:50S ribosomal protein L5 [candidate division WOR-3 bacterium]|nr:50S ribosomal protein L5 [candidate division WOR-3 bacterium]